MVNMAYAEIYLCIRGIFFCIVQKRKKDFSKKREIMAGREKVLYES